jgi:hypothetical protein
MLLHYVVWLDVMGARQAMAQSLVRSSNHIGRLHVCILKHINRDLCIVPFMDGAYIVSNHQEALFAFLHNVFEDLAYNFVCARRPEYRFLPRCGIAYGNLIHGVDIPTSVNIILGAKSHTWYRESVLFGIPMVQAYQTEAQAAPFGVAVHESSRDFAPEGHRPISCLWWHWYENMTIHYFDVFRRCLADHFQWCAENHFGLNYPLDRVHAHRDMAHEYFDIARHAV